MIVWSFLLDSLILIAINYEIMQTTITIIAHSSAFVACSSY